MRKEPKSNKMKSAERTEAANEAALALGFDTWRKFETAIKNAHAKGRLEVVEKRTGLYLKLPLAIGGSNERN